MQQVNERLNPPFSGLTFSVCTVLFFVASLIAGGITSAMALPKESDGYIYISYLAAPIAVSLGCFGMLFYKKVSFKEVFPVKCGAKYFVIALMIIFGLMFSFMRLNEMFVAWLKSLGYRANTSRLPDLSGGKVVLAVFVIAVIPAFVEEFFFRGIVLQGAKQGMGSIIAVFVSGAMFSLFHASPEQTIYQLICGCAFAYLAERSGAVTPCVLMHFLNNAAIIIFSACGLADKEGNLAIGGVAEIVLTVLGAIFLVAGILWLIFDKKEYAKSVKGGVLGFFVFASVGIVILASVWISSLFIV